jgi:hypothetical protein
MQPRCAAALCAAVGYPRRVMGDASWREVDELVAELEALQRRKVLELARRLRPGLTLEDISNPHDFPELGDPDWQYEDGMLAGIQSVLAAVRARRRESGG